MPDRVWLVMDSSGGGGDEVVAVCATYELAGRERLRQANGCDPDLARIYWHIEEWSVISA